MHLHAVAGLGAMLSRALYGPPMASLPVANPTLTTWMTSPPFPEVDANSKDLPEMTDYVIIGTGLAGLAATKAVLEISHDQRTEMPLSVVALDARAVCSGATARVGGQLVSSPYEHFAALKAALGGSADAARDTLTLMRRQLDMLKELGHDVPIGEVRDVEAVDMFLDAEGFDEAKGLVHDLETHMPEIEVHVWTSEEAQNKFGCNNRIVGAISYAAGAGSLYRLVTGVWKGLVDKYPELVLRSNTPVESITVAPNSPQHPYAVNTAQGTVRARHVLHATDGYAPYLLPRLADSLTGGRVSMSAYDAGARFPATHGGRSWRIINSTLAGHSSSGSGYDDRPATQRPDKSDGSSGDVMSGIGDEIALRSWDDSVSDEAPLDVLPTVFKPNWGGGNDPNAGTLTRLWNGIVGVTGDGLPFVGLLDQTLVTERTVTSAGAGVGGREGSGEWIAAGFNTREGMASAWLSGVAAGVMMTGQDQVPLVKFPGRPEEPLDSWFPRGLMAVDEARLKRAHLGDAVGK